VELDPDIAAMELSEGEKMGLQVFRNYKVAFDSHAEKKFASVVDSETHELRDLSRVLDIVAREVPRIVPIIACAYADDLLLAMYKRDVPEGVPGGKAALFGSFGPFSRLSSQIQLAFCFDLVNSDILIDLDRLRKIRNEISDSWFHEPIEFYFAQEPINRLFAIEGLLSEEYESLKGAFDKLSAERNFKIRLGWVLARLTYEALFYARAKRYRLDPRSALYGPNQPKLLKGVALCAMLFTRRIAHEAGSQGSFPIG